MSIWILNGFICSALKKVFWASFDASSPSSFICIFLSCWVHVALVFTSFQTDFRLWLVQVFLIEHGIEVGLRSFHCIFRHFSFTKEAPFEILFAVTLNFQKSHFSSIHEFAAVGKCDNGVSLEQWRKLLSSGDLTSLLKAHCQVWDNFWQLKAL